MQSRWAFTGAIALAVIITGCGQLAAPPRASMAHANGTAVSFATDAVIAREQAALGTHPADQQAADTLAGAYLQKVREVGDPGYYPKIESLLRGVLAHDASDSEATILMGSLALARHQFASALDWGKRAHALDPAGSRPLGIMGDAQVELGRYPDALKNFQAMVDLRPDLSAYARVSYARELYGDSDGAIEAMTQAVEAGGPVPENSAYTRFLLGNLYFNRGRLDEARQQYQRALFDDAGYPYALAGLARVDAASGRYPQAIAGYRKAVDVYPLPDFVIGLGDAYAASGDQPRASETYDLAAAELQLYQANGVDLDAELALFQADHRRDLSGALAAARRAIADRPSVRTADILAWTLYQVGDYREALNASRQAHRLGTQDAIFYFHTGMIEARLGMSTAAVSDLRQAQRINPNFSLIWAAVARETLASLGSAS